MRHYLLFAEEPFRREIYTDSFDCIDSPCCLHVSADYNTYNRHHHNGYAYHHCNNSADYNANFIAKASKYAGN
jgi:hypothetical protein